MGRARTGLELSESDAARLEELYKRCRDVKELKRLELARLAIKGLYTREELAERSGLSRTRVQELLVMARAGGLDGLLERQAPGGNYSQLQEPHIQEAMKAQQDAGKIRTAGDMQRYLEREHGIVRKAKSLYKWMGRKLGAALRVPRPVHVKKDPQAAQAFLAGLEAQLKSLRLKKGKAVRIWVQDEGRFGRHTIVRSAWARRGHRLVLPTQRKYRWGYLYGALELGTGASEFAYWDGVDMDISTEFLRRIVRSEPGAQQVVIWDGAGFHLRADCRPIPRGVRLIVLPPYSPELNPIEKLWDVLKDGLCNQVFDTMDALWETVTAQLQALCQPQRILQLLGTGSTVAPANASSNN
jgi:transposase